MSKTPGFGPTVWTRSLMFGLAALGCTACTRKADDTASVKASASTYDGTWSSGCQQDREAGTYEITAIAIAGSSVTSTLQGFSDKACKVGIGLNITMTGDYAIGAAASAGTGAKEFDVTPSKGTATPADVGTAVGLNTAKFCGADDWSKGVAKDVSTCKDDTGRLLTAKFFDIIKFAADGKSFMNGKADATYNGYTAAKRPVALNTAIVYTKL